MRVGELLKGLEFGEPQTHRNLAVIGLYGKDVLAGDLLTLQEALCDNTVRIAESGVISYLWLENRGMEPVFIPVGATIEGRSQNRASSYPAIVPSDSGVINLPVNCAEEGQGFIRDAEFNDSTTIVIASARSGEVRQDRTWDSIEVTQSISTTCSRTSDYVTIRGGIPGIGGYLGMFEGLKEGHRGYVAAVRNNGDFSFYADILGSRGLFGKLCGMLYESVGAEAGQRMTHAGEYSGPIRVETSVFERFLDEAKDRELVRKDVGYGSPGETYLLDGPISGSAILLGGSPVQLSLRGNAY